MAELVYARALGARGATLGGSSPLPSTIARKTFFALSHKAFYA